MPLPQTGVLPGPAEQSSGRNERRGRRANSHFPLTSDRSLRGKEVRIMMRIRVASVLLALGLLAGSTGMASHSWAAQAGPAGKMAAEGTKPSAEWGRTPVTGVNGV